MIENHCYEYTLFYSKIFSIAFSNATTTTKIASEKRARKRKRTICDTLIEAIYIRVIHHVPRSCVNDGVMYGYFRNTIYIHNTYIECNVIESQPQRGFSF